LCLSKLKTEQILTNGKTLQHKLLCQYKRHRMVNSWTSRWLARNSFNSTTNQLHPSDRRIPRTFLKFVDFTKKEHRFKILPEVHKVTIATGHKLQDRSKDMISVSSWSKLKNNICFRNWVYVFLSRVQYYRIHLHLNQLMWNNISNQLKIHYQRKQRRKLFWKEKK
jgi:hypothetical protein